MADSKSGPELHPTTVRAVSLPECSHLPQEECPEEVSRHLLDFLEGWNG